MSWSGRYDAPGGRAGNRRRKDAAENHRRSGAGREKVYAESNLENTDFFCPEEPDKEAAVRMVESGFLDFLKNEFFKEP